MRVRTGIDSGAFGFVRGRMRVVSGVSGFNRGCVLVGWVKPVGLLLVVLVAWL